METERVWEEEDHIAVGSLWVSPGDVGVDASICVIAPVGSPL